MVCIRQVKLFCGDGAVRDVLCVLLYSSMVCILNLNGLLLLLLLLRPLSYSNGVCIRIRWWDDVYYLWVLLLISHKFNGCCIRSKKRVN